MRNILPAAALLILLAIPAHARDVFVNNVAGDDGASGANQQVTADRTGPVSTIAKALRLATTGDRIVLANTGEPYRESISLVGSRLSGYPFAPLVIAGNGAILDGSAPIPPDAWEHYRAGVFRFRPKRLEYQQLFLDGRPAPRVIPSEQADGPPPMKPLHWCLHNQYLYFCVEQDKLPEDYNLSCANLRTGITLYHVRYVTILDLTLQGFQLDGVNAFNSATEVNVVGVTSRGNGRSGVTVGGASRTNVEACLIGNNGDAQILTLPCSETHVNNCDVLGNTAPALVDQGGRTYVNGEPVRGGLPAIETQPAAEKPAEQPAEQPQPIGL